MLLGVFNMSIETVSYSVCDDCIQYLANDEVKHENETHESMGLHIKRECGNRNAHFAVGYHTRVYRVIYCDGTLVVTQLFEANYEESAINEVKEQNGDDIEIISVEDITDEYEYYDFSYSQCDLCKSNLGGSRHAATLIINGD